MLKEDKQMILKVRKPDNANEDMINLLKNYFHKKKCAYYAKLVLITIIDKETKEPLENEHYCIIVKPQKKYNTEKDNFKLFQLMEPYLDENADFVDFSILGNPKFMQIYEDNYMIMLYE